MFEPRKVYPTGKSQADKDMFHAGLEEAKRLIVGSHFPHELAGQEINSLSGKTYKTFDPNTGQELATLPEHDLNDIAERARLSQYLDLVGAAYKRWRLVDPQDRIRLARTISQFVMFRMPIFLGAMALSGKRPFPNGVGEFMEIADFIDNAIDLYQNLLEEAPPVAPDFMGDFDGWHWEPKGVFVDIGPFNFPNAIPMNYIILAILTGNVIIMKSSGHTAHQGYLLYKTIQDAFDHCGIKNEGVVNFLSGHGGDLANFLLGNKNVVGYSFTGSWDAYWKIQETHVAKPRLSGAKLQEAGAEMSGCNALIVASDVQSEEDMSASVNGAVLSTINYCGQTCSHLGHLIIDDSIKDRYVKKLQEAFEAVKFGDIKDLSNQCGAVISKEAADRCRATVTSLVKKGYVDILYIKDVPGDNPRNFAPTIMIARPHVMDDAEALHEVRSAEIFGMSIVLWFVDSREQAKCIFEAGKFALTGGLHSNDLDYCLDFATNYRGAGQKYVGVGSLITGATVGMAFGGLATSGSSGDGSGAGSMHQMKKYVSQVNVAVRIPKNTKGFERDYWKVSFANKMAIAPPFKLVP